TNFDTANVTDMSGMFSDCSSLVSLNLTNFYTAKVTDMSFMFYNCKSLASLNLTNFYTANVTRMHVMFYNCSSLKSLDLTNFYTEKVTNMYNMFYNCKSLASLNLTNFNTEKVTDMSEMFNNCRSLTTIYCNDDWSVGGKVKDHSGMFIGCPNLRGEGAAYDSSKTGIEMANPTTGYFTAKTNGIDHVKAAGKVGDGKIYDLSGRQVSKNYKGVVIMNGRKILQR
ncbi:BspA family leucine-rich repeat surface protein, partial [Hoylesella timonensis]